MKLRDLFSFSSKPSKTRAGPGRNWSYDWCRFRKNSRCKYPTELNQVATNLAKYAVWVPEDRANCPRMSWDDQNTCSIGEPGPHVPGGYTDATVPWEEGGQRGAHSAPAYRTLAEESEPTVESTSVATGREAARGRPDQAIAGGQRHLRSLRPGDHGRPDPRGT